MESEYIYHVTTRKEWEDAQKNNEYKPAGYDQEGFIHCSIERQIAGVLERFYKGKTGLVKLKIEKAKVAEKVEIPFSDICNEPTAEEIAKSIIKEVDMQKVET